jgi:hypothetical protein
MAMIRANQPLRALALYAAALCVAVCIFFCAAALYAVALYAAAVGGDLILFD